jgi:protein-disulfide isomerase
MGSRRVTPESLPTSDTPKSAAPAPLPQGLGKYRILIVLCVWFLCVVLVGFLSLRHAKVALRNSLASSVAAGSAAPIFGFSTLAGFAIESDAGSAVSNLVAARDAALAWVPPLAKGTPSAGDRDAALEISTFAHVLGSHKAPVTLMLFGDLNCPYTLKMLKTLRAWLDEQPGAYRLVWRHRPLDIHPNAAKAALIAERLAQRSGEQSFWRFVIAMTEMDGLPSEAEYDELEQALQASHSKLSESAANTRAAANLEHDRLIALSYAIHATPTLFINGLRIEGEISRSHLEQVVNEERVEVQALLDDSVPAAKTYTIRVDANLLDLQR